MYFTEIKHNSIKYRDSNIDNSDLGCVYVLVIRNNFKYGHNDILIDVFSKFPSIYEVNKALINLGVTSINSDEYENIMQCFLDDIYIDSGLCVILKEFRWVN